MKKRIILGITLALSLTLAACGAKTDKKSGETQKLETVTIGVSPTPHGEIVKSLTDDFKKEGIEIKVVEFTDYVQPNLALAEKNLDLNYFQHVPYLEEFSKTHNLKLEVLGKVHLEPIGIYSKKYKSVNDIPEGAQIAIPNDPTNGARGLKLLEAQGLIKLKEAQGLTVTEKDIVENKKNLKIVPIEAATIAKTYEDVDAAVINANYAIGAGLKPTKDSIALESIEGNPNVNIVACREGEKNDEKLKKVMKVLNSQKAKEIIEQKFDGAVIPSFK